jgi:enamine deaminase RidA (YjgF/YER057c/UK114 family)
MSKEVISSDKAPAAIGPYSQAIRGNKLLYSYFCSIYYYVQYIYH